LQFFLIFILVKHFFCYTFALSNISVLIILLFIYYPFNQMNIIYSSLLLSLNFWGIVLITVPIIGCTVMSAFLFTLIKKQRIYNKSIAEIIENQQQNYEISQMLAEKMLEVETKERELRDINAELKWQSENALRLYDEVETQKKEMTDSIEYAQKIQRILLPEESFVNEILNDYFILFQPRDIVSGDFYWITAKENKTVVVVADCTGHGVPGAFMSLLGINFLNSITKDDSLTVDAILNQMRSQIIRALRQKDKELENRDGMDMAMCVIDWENSMIEFAGANISLFLLRNMPDSPNHLIEIRADRMPIGIYGGESKPFNKCVIPILPGDSIYMFSDGYCDQFGGDNLKKFKKKNLIKLLTEIHTLSMTKQKELIKQNFEDWRGDLPQVDDVLMMGIKI
jgi:serine phosphatase RsbU (regulator of sigma subunit)